MGNDSKSILRVGARSVSKRRAVWDERNLAMNEKIKQELDPSKIDEPKTPYHAPVDPDVDMEPLDLDADDGVPKASVSAKEPKRDAHSEQNMLVQVAFSKHRKSHYDMKNALATGKALLQKEDCNDD